MAAEPPVQWVCIVCFAAAAAAPGPCPRDGVPLSPVANEEVVAALRARQERRARRREQLRLSASLAAGVALSWPLHVVYGWPIVPRFADYGHGAKTFGTVLLLATLALAALSMLLVRPLASDGEPAQLLAQLGLDRPRQP